MFCFVKGYYANCPACNGAEFSSDINFVETEQELLDFITMNYQDYDFGTIYKTTGEIYADYYRETASHAVTGFKIIFSNGRKLILTDDGHGNKVLKDPSEQF